MHKTLLNLILNCIDGSIIELIPFGVFVNLDNCELNNIKIIHHKTDR